MTNPVIEEIKKSGLFDSEWYLNEYQDVKKSQMCPATHFISIGWKLGRNPSNNFSTKKYIDYYPDVKKSNSNPLIHYIRYGQKEGRAVFKSYDLPVNNEVMEEKKSIHLDNVTRILQWNETGTKGSKDYVSLLDTVKKNQAKISEDAVVKQVNPIPTDWPKDLVLQPLPESTNDYEWAKKYRKTIRPEKVGLSIIIPTFNRSHILSVTLAGLTHQETDYPFEVIVADDGSQEDVTRVIRVFESLLDIKYVRQKDTGYRLSAVRNLGIRTASFEFVSIIDCDMAPSPSWVQSNVNILLESDDVAVIGPRKYVDTSSLEVEACLKDKDFLINLPEVETNNSVAGGPKKGAITVDWRLKTFEETDNLRLSNAPFRFFSGGNVAFSKKWLSKAGWFDEEFEAWGGEDGEFGYRLYRAGCFFQSDMGALAYHQEPPGKENETDRAAGKAITEKLRSGKVPYFYRKPLPIEKSSLNPVPLVSIYIPAYNCENSIVRCVESALNQTVSDLEVCICDDGSTDNTLSILKNNYNDNPRVKYISQENGGIGAASNSAVRLCRGYYIGQLDSDDYLNPDAVELCLKELLKNHSLACVYTTNQNVDPTGKLISKGYNWPVFSREKLTTAMIAHHFRMFTARAWSQTDGFDERITNAVDYDMFLKLSEIGPFKHINKVCYNRVLHGENTSIKQLAKQKENHFVVTNNSFTRQSIEKWSIKSLNNDDHCRKYLFEDEV